MSAAPAGRPSGNAPDGPSPPDVEAIPRPARSRLLRELRGDLEGAYRAYLDRGVPAEEARRRARALVLPSESALDSLAHLHEPLYQRLAGRFDPRSMRWLERAAVVLLSLFGVLTVGASLDRLGGLAGASRFLPAALAVGGTTLALGLAKAFQLFVKREHGGLHLRRGLGGILALAAATLGAGLAGTLVDLHRLTGRMQASAQPVYVIEFIADSAALLAVSLGLALAGALVWFLLLHWIVVTESELVHFAEEILTAPAGNRPERRQE